MKKPIIAVKLTGVLVSHEPWEKAHLLWFKEASIRLNRPDIALWGSQYTQKDDYFRKVDEIIALEFPSLDVNERQIKARKLFFEYVLKYISLNPEILNLELIDELKGLKSDFNIALISSSEETFVNKLLNILNISYLFDFVYCSSLRDKDDFSIVYNRFISQHKEVVREIF